MADSSDIDVTVHEGEVLLTISGINGGIEILLTPEQCLELIESLASGAQLALGSRK